MQDTAIHPHPIPGRDATDERSRHSREYYEALAAQFDRLDDYWSNPYDSATWRLENELIARYLGGADPLLDLGVGFYPHVESTAGRHVVCLDISDGSLQVARTVYQDHNPRMTYVCADGIALPLPDGAVNAIVAGGELINHTDARLLLTEMHRVLRPGGRVLLSIAMKWCLDSLYCLLDAFLGLGIGYSMTRTEAADFVASPSRSSDVTWEVTPNARLRVTLYAVRHLRALLAASGFAVLAMRSLNMASAIVPLPIQQDEETHRFAKRLATGLLALDHAIFGRVPGVRWFAGNVYLVLAR